MPMVGKPATRWAGAGGLAVCLPVATVSPTQPTSPFQTERTQRTSCNPTEVACSVQIRAATQQPPEADRRPKQIHCLHLQGGPRRLPLDCYVWKKLLKLMAITTFFPPTAGSDWPLGPPPPPTHTRSSNDDHNSSQHIRKCAPVHGCLRFFFKPNIPIISCVEHTHNTKTHNSNFPSAKI